MSSLLTLIVLHALPTYPARDNTISIMSVGRTSPFRLFILGTLGILLVTSITTTDACFQGIRERNKY
jgi:hypothetical protein